jgi:FG-GAP-like repeat
MGCRRTVVAIAVTAVVTLPVAAGAQSLQLVADQFPSAPGARGIVAADFDRNGWIDIAHANAGSNNVTILLNQRRSDSALVRTRDVPVGAGPFDLTSGDFNRDGIVDLAVANADAHTISILTGRPSGAFTRVDLPAPRGPRGIDAAHVNDDGRLDLIVTGWENGTVQVLLGNGAGGFAAGPSFSGYAPHPQGVDTADFNRDGHPDLVVAYESGGGIAVLSGNGGTAFTARGVNTEPNLNVVTAADFNRDGWMDAAAASTAANRVAIYLGGVAGLRFSDSYLTGPSPRGIVAADVNHDGMIDVVTANRTNGTVSVLLGRASAPGTFNDARDFAAGPGSRAVAAADFNRDGRLDLATGNQNASAASVLRNGTAFDTAGFSFGRIQLGTVSPSRGGRNEAWPADFDEDGRLDVLVTADFVTAGRRLDVLLTGRGLVPLPFDHFFDGFSTADFNNDSHADVIVWQGYPDAIISVFFGDGRGRFSPAVQTAVPLVFWEGVIGELNGDGIPDLVFNAFDPAAFSDAIQMLWGAGDGTFRRGTRIPSRIDSPTVVDANRDGKMDVVGVTESGLIVWAGNGAGGFRIASTTPWGDLFVDSVALGDLNADGFLDVVTSSQDGVRVALGTATGFGTPTDYPHLGEPFVNSRNVAIADITMDGHLDLVSDTGSVVRGLGDGTFAEPDRFAYDGTHVHIADFTRDGLPDVIIATFDGAAEVIVNRRRHVNRPPTVSVGADRTFEYADQFAEDPPTVFAASSDPDLHALAFEWRDANGTVVDTFGTPFLEIEGRRPGTYTFTVTVRDGRGGSASDTVNVTIAPTKEVVVWASNSPWEAIGKWTMVEDSTAAGGSRAHDPNAGAPKVNAPLPQPSSRFSLVFIADPTQTYKLWVRLKADGNRFSNDSVWAQFSGSTDAAGNPVYRIGSSSGLPINLEECSNCGLSGWGWEDDGWGAVNRNGVTLQFPEGGLQVIQFQTREDGVSIDQVVLSSEKYLTARPGAAKNDATILMWTFHPGG